MSEPKEHAQILTDDEVSTLLLTGVIMTRQPVDPQPPGVYSRLVWYCYGGKWGAHPPGSVSGECWSGRCPLGEVGGLVWVREPHAWADVFITGYEKEDPVNVGYRGDVVHQCTPDHVVMDGQDFDWWATGSKKWRRAGTMPKWAARIWLRIDEVRVEKAECAYVGGKCNSSRCPCREGWVWVRKCIVASTAGRPE